MSKIIIFLLIAVGLTVIVVAAQSPLAKLNESCTIADELNELITMHNLARSKARMCGTTRFPATKPLVWSCRLNEAARAHVNDMAEKQFLDHLGSDGLSFTDRINRLGFDWVRAAENIGRGYPSALLANEAWLSSAQHCANIMNGDHEFFGAARVNDYWATLFAR